MHFSLLLEGIELTSNEVGTVVDVWAAKCSKQVESSLPQDSVDLCYGFMSVHLSVCRLQAGQVCVLPNAAKAIRLMEHIGPYNFKFTFHTICVYLVRF